MSGPLGKLDPHDADVARWAFLNPETGDWIEVKPGTVVLAASERPPVDPLRLYLEGRDDINPATRSSIIALHDAALASPAAPRPHVVVNAAGQCACGARWSEEHAASFAAAAPRPEGLERVANAIYESMVRPETIWWDDLTPELQEPYLRAARAVASLSDTGDTP